MGGLHRLSAVEASFVGLERDGLPMHVGGLVVFRGEPPLTLGELEHHAARRLSRLPKFHERLRMPFAGGRPAWEPAGRVRFRAHFIHHLLASPGRPSQLRALCASIHERPLDRSRPLWEIHLIDGLAGGRQALLVKTHHAMTDGIAGIEVAEVLFDPAPNARRPTLRALNYAESGGGPPGWRALQAVLGAGFTAAGGPIAVEGPFNGPVGPRRSFGTAELSLDAIGALKRRTGGSVDDVVIALVAAGLRRHLVEAGYPSLPDALRAMIPVSTRLPVRGVRLGNQVSSVFVDLPMRELDLAAIVRTVAASKSVLRTAHAVAGSTMLVEAAGLLPGPLHNGVLRVVSRLPIANLVLSDVPGPDGTMYLAGRRIEACYPMLPLTGNVGLTVATLSMGGVMGVGVTAAPNLVPDPQRIASAIHRALAEEISALRRDAVRPHAA